MRTVFAHRLLQVILDLHEMSLWQTLKGDFFFAICEKAMFMLHIFLKKVEYIMLFFKMIFYRMIADVSSFEEV